MRNRTAVDGLKLLAAAGLLVLAVLTAAVGQEKPDFRAQTPPPGAIWLETLDVARISQDYGRPRVGRSVDNQPIRLAGVNYPHGIGTHAASEFHVDLKGGALRFAALAGLDDERRGNGSVTFEVWVDGKKAAETPVLHGGDPPRVLSVDLRGARRLLLIVTDAGDGITNDHADWAGAHLVLKPGAPPPVAIGLDEGPAPPIRVDTSPVPAIHGPRVAGTTPGRPFLYRIPATGEGPLAFTARNLPEGITLDERSGILRGTAARAGTTVLELQVQGPRGTAHRRLTLIAGEHRLALTPPMGWNSWNVWATSVDAEKVRQAADGLIRSGLAAHGYQYVNIDDAWEGPRAADGQITTNAKFPSMKALSDYIHDRGLRLGIYSSPGPKTCAGYEGSYQHEEQDARTYAAWGVDYLKYDWCSYGTLVRMPGLPELQQPYRLMRAALDGADRDIAYSLCQYGMGNVWEWGAQVGGNLWRTTGDITDTWSSLQGIGFRQHGHEPFAGPGHWNDPDMLVVGKIGWGPNLHPTRLSPNEQITHITLWSLLAAPLLIGCDLTDLDSFTLAVLTNDEVLDVDQDMLGKPAARRSQQGPLEVWSRPLWDGTTAVGLFNRGREKAAVTAGWADLGLEGAQPVRDLWLRKDLGPATGSFTADVPAHGAMLLRLGRPAATP